MRPGHELFFIDLPDFEERQDVFGIHLLKRRRNPEKFDLVRLARETEGFSGAEIEQAVIAGLYDAFEAGRDLEEPDLVRNVAQSIPLSQTMREQVTALRNWAHTHARPASSNASARRIVDASGTMAISAAPPDRAVQSEGR